MEKPLRSDYLQIYLYFANLSDRNVFEKKLHLPMATRTFGSKDNSWCLHEFLDLWHNLYLYSLHPYTRGQCAWNNIRLTYIKEGGEFFEDRRHMEFNFEFVPR